MHSAIAKEPFFAVFVSVCFVANVSAGEGMRKNAAVQFLQ